MRLATQKELDKSFRFFSLATFAELVHQQEVSTYIPTEYHHFLVGARKMPCLTTSQSVVEWSGV